MNGKERSLPPAPTGAISIFDLIQMRIDLEQIESPSDDIRRAIDKLDAEIVHFTDGLRH